MAFIGLMMLMSDPAWCQFPSNDNSFHDNSFNRDASSHDLEFQIHRNGEPFGLHKITFDHEKDQVTAHIKIKMKVKMAFITLFKYKHENKEIYKGNKLVSIDAHTNDNGKTFKVKARRKGDSIAVDGPEGKYDAPIDISASTYWNRDMLFRQQVLNTQTGELQPLDAQMVGLDKVHVDGEYIEAEHYVVNVPDQKIDIWYDVETGQMVDLSFEIMGSLIDYERITPMRYLTAAAN